MGTDRVLVGNLAVDGAQGDGAVTELPRAELGARPVVGARRLVDRLAGLVLDTTAQATRATASVLQPGGWSLAERDPAHGRRSWRERYGKRGPIR